MHSVHENPETVTLFGTPQEVRAQLGKSHAEKVLAVSFEHIEKAAFELLAENITTVMSVYSVALRKPKGQVLLNSLVEILLPTRPTPSRLLKESFMLARARKAVLESGDWLTAANVAQLAGLSDVNPSAQPNKWKKKSLIFAIHHNGVDYYPGYGLDSNADFRPIKALADVIEIFAGHKDAWGMAYWFRSQNSFLGGKRPQDLLGTQSAQVIEAARDEIQAVAHG